MAQAAPTPNTAFPGSSRRVAQQAAVLAAAIAIVVVGNQVGTYAVQTFPGLLVITGLPELASRALGIALMAYPAVRLLRTPYVQMRSAPARHLVAATVLASVYLLGVAMSAGAPYDFDNVTVRITVDADTASITA